MAANKTNEGVINAGELYTLAQLKTRLGLTDSSARELRMRGLPLIRVGKRAFASGRQVIEFLEGIAENEDESLRG